MFLHLRVHEQFDTVVAWLRGQDIAGFGVFENAGREHMHFVLVVEKTIAAFRKSFKRSFPTFRGNKDYSLEEAQDFSKLRRYVAKGESRDCGPDVRYQYGAQFLNEHIALWHQQYWTENATLNAQKRKRGNIMVETERECRDRKIAWNDRDGITEVYCEMVKNAGKTYDINLARRTVRGIMIAMCPNESYKKDMVEVTWY